MAEYVVTLTLTLEPVASAQDGDFNVDDVRLWLYQRLDGDYVETEQAEASVVLHNVAVTED